MHLDNRYGVDIERVYRNLTRWSYIFWADQIVLLIFAMIFIESRPESVTFSESAIAFKWILPIIAVTNIPTAYYLVRYAYKQPLIEGGGGFAEYFYKSLKRITIIGFALVNSGIIFGLAIMFMGGELWWVFALEVPSFIGFFFLKPRKDQIIESLQIQEAHVADGRYYEQSPLKFY